MDTEVKSTNIMTVAKPPLPPATDFPGRENCEQWAAELQAENLLLREVKREDLALVLQHIRDWHVTDTPPQLTPGLRVVMHQLARCVAVDSDGYGIDERDLILMRIFELLPSMLLGRLHCLHPGVDSARVKAVVDRLDGQQFPAYLCMGRLSAQSVLAAWKRPKEIDTPFTPGPLDAEPYVFTERLKPFITCMYPAVRRSIEELLPVTELIEIVLSYVMVCELKHPETPLCGFDRTLQSILRTENEADAVMPLLRVAFAVKRVTREITAQAVIVPATTDASRGEQPSPAKRLQSRSTVQRSLLECIDRDPPREEEETTGAIPQPPVPQVRPGTRGKRTYPHVINADKAVQRAIEHVLDSPGTFLLDFQCMDYLVGLSSAVRQLQWSGQRRWTLMDYDYMHWRGWENLISQMAPKSYEHMSGDYLAFESARRPARRHPNMFLCVESLYGHGLYCEMESFTREVILPAIRECEVGGNTQGPWRGACRELVLEALLRMEGRSLFPGIIRMWHGILHKGLYDALIARLMKEFDIPVASREA